MTRITRRTVLKSTGLASVVVLTGAGTAAGQQGGDDDGPARLRILHASPDAPAVDVLVDDEAVLEDASFTDITDYEFELDAGTYNVKVVPTGESADEAVIDADVELAADTDYTIAAVNELADIAALVLEDDNSGAPDDAARIRVVHLSPDAPAVDVAVADGDTLVSDLSFLEQSEYLEVPGDSYTLDVLPTGEDEPVFTFDVELENGVTYSAFALGFLFDEDDEIQTEGEQGFRVLPVVDDPQDMEDDDMGGDGCDDDGGS